MPYQEWRRERPDEARQPVDSRCQIRRQTKDEGSYHNTFRIFGTSFFAKNVLHPDCLLYTSDAADEL